MSNISHLFHLQHRFDDFERFATTVRGWDVDFRPLDPGDFEAQISQVATSEILLTEAVFNRRLDQKGGAPSGTWTFAILASGSPDVIWRGQTFTDQMIAVFPPGADIDASSPPGFHVMTISIPLAVFEGWDALNEMDARGRTQPLCRLIGADPLRLAQIRRMVRYTVSTVDTEMLSAAETLQEISYQVVAALFDARSIRSKASVEKRTRLVNTLTAYIDAHLKNPISLTDLCADANVSPRTVQYAFMDRFGVSPKQYIQARRLHRVYQDLCSAKRRGKCIADVANEWGFWHMGQFAADYRKFFGELPSVTHSRDGSPRSVCGS